MIWKEKKRPIQDCGSFVPNFRNQQGSFQGNFPARLIGEREREREREYVHCVVVNKNYLTKLGELIIAEPWRDIYQFLQPS